MGSSLIDKLFRRSGDEGSFVSAAKRRGVPSAVAKILEPGAQEIGFMEPEMILESRELYEMVVMRAVINDARNLELSFGTVDKLAGSIERLKLEGPSEELSPFRRVWLENGAGGRIRGATFTCQAGEVAVFCPARSSAITDIGMPVKLSYRGVQEAVDHELTLNDVVRLPGAQVLHLTQAEQPEGLE